MTESERRVAIAELPSHPGYIELLKDLSEVSNAVLAKMRTAQTDEEILKFARLWITAADFASVLQYYPEELKTFVEQEKVESLFYGPRT